MAFYGSEVHIGLKGLVIFSARSPFKTICLRSSFDFRLIQSICFLKTKLHFHGAKISSACSLGTLDSVPAFPGGQKKLGIVFHSDEILRRLLIGGFLTIGHRI